MTHLMSTASQAAHRAKTTGWASCITVHHTEDERERDHGEEGRVGLLSPGCAGLRSGSIYPTNLLIFGNSVGVDDILPYLQCSKAPLPAAVAVWAWQQWPRCSRSLEYTSAVQTSRSCPE